VSQAGAKKNDLAKLVATLEQSRDEIQEQNAKLQFLASRDPLTKMLQPPYILGTVREGLGHD
jgi:hypothetical protein